jgi:NB-ARC domain
MPDDQFLPAHSDLVTDLKVLRRTGRWRLRNRDLPALERAARLDSADLQDLGIAIDNLVRRAIDNLDDGQLGQAAMSLFGYTRGKRGVAVSELRREAARIYGVTPESFRHGAEKVIIDQIATEILKLIDRDRVSEGPAGLFRDTEQGARQERFLETAPYQALVQPGHSWFGGTAGWRGPVFAVPPLRGDEIARPGLMEDLVGMVTRPGISVVGMTTGLWGVGGFGKTTLARLLAHRKEIREQFCDAVVWVTVGEDAAGPELAEKVINVVCLLCGDRLGLTDPVAAGAELGRVLGDRRVLLIVDDVWSAAQVEPFMMGGSGTVRLFTTRIRGVLPGSAQLVRVDQMGRDEAEQLLTAGVEGMSGAVVAGLLAVTGRWPVLLALVNGAVRADQGAGRAAEDSMREILGELRATGPTALDVTDASERHMAVDRTIGVSLSRLTDQQRDRYLELAVFAEDVEIPGPVLTRYWSTTSDWPTFQSRRYCQRLAELALASDYR